MSSNIDWWKHDFENLCWALTEVARIENLKALSSLASQEKEYDRMRELKGIMITFAEQRLLFGAEIWPRAGLLMKDGTVI